VVAAELPAPYVVGVMAPASMAPRLLGPFAAAAERAGFGELWVAEDCFLSGGIAQAAVALATTTRLCVGIGIMPAAARNVAFAALDLSFLASAFPGRLTIGVGHGMTGWLRQAGAWPASPLTLMAEYLDALRALLGGETVTVDGRYVKLTDVRLEHVPAVRPLLVAGVRGPKSLALAGRHADGTILAEPVTAAYLRTALPQIGFTSEHRIVAYNVAAVDDSAQAARERVRGALWWAADPAWAPEIAPLPFAAELPALRRSAGSDAEFTRRLPGEWIDQLALVGTPSVVRARLEELSAAGGQHLIMCPAGDDPVGALSQLARVL
jgi:5,10-methylenetetrahydromethanopterin reductase